jgi:hypothetical protein
VVVVCADRWEATLIEEQIEKGRKQCGIRRRVRVTAGKAARFGKVAVGLIDDAALVKDEVYEALRTGVGAARGVLWAMGTPRGQSGFFWKAFDGAEIDGEWLRVCVPAEECERLPKEFLAEERAALGEERYASEYGCLFAGEVEKRAILQWVDENGEIYGRFGPGVDWMRHRDGEWKG